MATSLVFKVRKADGELLASCQLLTDATLIACRHGKGTKISHMHFGMLATVGFLGSGHEGIVFRAARIKLDEKCQKLREEHEASLERERQRRLAKKTAKGPIADGVCLSCHWKAEECACDD